MAEHYFQSVRLLTYQLLYSPSTRSNASYPILLPILVPPTPSKRNRRRLASDGAILINAEPLTPTGPADDAERLAALRLWALTQWHKICFIDARALVLEPGIESVFVDRAATLPVLAKGGERGWDRTAGKPSVCLTTGTESRAGEGRGGWRRAEGRCGSVRAEAG